MERGMSEWDNLVSSLANLSRASALNWIWCKNAQPIRELNAQCELHWTPWTNIIEFYRKPKWNSNFQQNSTKSKKIRRNWRKLNEIEENSTKLEKIEENSTKLKKIQRNRRKLNETSEKLISIALELNTRAALTKIRARASITSKSQYQFHSCSDYLSNHKHQASSNRTKKC